MADRKPIKTFEGVILGWIITENNGDQKATDFYGVVLGFYRSRYDHTTDFYGRVLSKGNILASLIMNNPRK